MSDDNPEGLPKPQPDFAGIPPWPPKPTAHDLEDDGRPHLITVSLTEHRQLSDKTESTLPIADFTFDSGRSKHEHQSLTLRDIPPVSVFANYLADGGGFLSVLVSQSGRDLVSLHSRAPFNAFSTFRLSSDTTVMISCFQGKR